MAGPPPLWVLNPSGQRASGEWIDDTLRQRAEENGLLGKSPLAARFPRQRVEVVRGDDPASEVDRLFYLRGWTDGLPITPPTTGRVQEALSWVPEAAGEILGELDPLKGLATVEKVAVNAVMAGCLPEHLPVVLAAVRAIADPAFNLRGVQTTDENVAPLIIVSGPVAQAIGMNASFGALGPGWKPNAAIGRAVRFVMNNIGGGWPGAVSFAGLGQPGRYTLCLAERAEFNPWDPLHVELGFAPEESAVVITRAETAINVTGGLNDIASVMASAASGFAMLHNGVVAVLVAPFVAKELAEQGFGKDDVKRRLWDQGRFPAEEWRRTWLHQRLIDPDQWPAWVRAAAATGSIPAVEKPEDIVLFVAGGDIPIPQCAYFPSWGFPACRIAKRIALPDDWPERLAVATAG
jgi:hypothetical protein